MKYPFITLLLFLLSVATISAADTVVHRVTEGGKSREASTEGEITKFTKEAVILKDRVKNETSIPANTVIEIRYSKEPENMQVIRTAMDSSQFEDAIAQIRELIGDKTKSLTEFQRQDLDFYSAYANAQLALAKMPDHTISSAGNELSRFVSRYPDSYHFYEAKLLIGRLLTLDGKKPDEAKKVYEEVLGAPWQEIQLEARVALGQLSLQLENAAEAEAMFLDVVGSRNDGSPEALEQQNFARLGLARAKAMGNDYEGAKTILDQILNESDSGNMQLQASLYNAYGDIALAAGKNTEALLAFLHTDLIFSGARSEHIYALKKLVELWKIEKREDRSNEARALLLEQYGITP